MLDESGHSCPRRVLNAQISLVRVCISLRISVAKLTNLPLLSWMSAFGL